MSKPLALLLATPLAALAAEGPIQDNSFLLHRAHRAPGDSPNGHSGIGDVALNYRYQLLGDGEAKLAIAPRFTVFLPSGNETLGPGWVPLATRLCFR